MTDDARTRRLRELLAEWQRDVDDLNKSARAKNRAFAHALQRAINAVETVLVETAVLDTEGDRPTPEALKAVIAEMENYGAGLPSAAADRVWKWAQRLRALTIADTEGDRPMANEFRDAVQALHDYGGMFSRTPLTHDDKGELITTSELMTLVARVMSLSGKWLRADTEGDRMKEGFAGLPFKDQGFAGLPNHLQPSNLPIADTEGDRPMQEPFREAVQRLVEYSGPLSITGRPANPQTELVVNREWFDRVVGVLVQAKNWLRLRADTEGDQPTPDHDTDCERELTSHGYTPCRCHERAGICYCRKNPCICLPDPPVQP
jgi:hypothetical protein